MSAERPPVQAIRSSSHRTCPCSRQAQGVEAAEHCCVNPHLQGLGHLGPSSSWRAPLTTALPAPALPRLALEAPTGGVPCLPSTSSLPPSMVSMRRHGVPVGCGPWAVPRSTGASKPAPDACSLPPRRWPQLPRPRRCPAARQPGLVWSEQRMLLRESHGLVFRGRGTSAAQAQQHEARPWCSHSPRLPLPGAPCESFLPEGLASQGHGPHPLSSATAKGPDRVSQPLRWAPQPCYGVAGRGQTPQPGQGPLPPPLSATRQAGHRGPARDGRVPLSPSGLGTGRWSVSNFGFRSHCQSPLSHCSSLPDSKSSHPRWQPASQSQPPPAPSPATTGLGEGPWSPEAGLWQVAGGGGSRAP